MPQLQRDPEILEPFLPNHHFGSRASEPKGVRAAGLAISVCVLPDADSIVGRDDDGGLVDRLAGHVFRFYGYL